jgi:hypothetical protein
MFKGVFTFLIIWAFLGLRGSSSYAQNYVIPEPTMHRLLEVLKAHGVDEKVWVAPPRKEADIDRLIWAINQTKYPSDLSKINNLSFSDSSYDPSMQYDNVLSLNLNESENEWIRVLSTDPAKEVDFTNYRSTLIPQTNSLLAKYLGTVTTGTSVQKMKIK